jgi:hypothetical protein
VSTTAGRPTTGRRAAAGWWLLIAVGVLLLVNGLWLATAVRSPDVFAQDTGVSIDEVRAAYPRVVSVMNARGTLVGVMLAGLGAVTVVLAWGGRRAAPRTAWAALVVVALVLLTLSVVAFVFENALVGAVYLFFAFATGAGLALVAASRS